VNLQAFCDVEGNTAQNGYGDYSIAVVVKAVGVAAGLDVNSDFNTSDANPVEPFLIDLRDFSRAEHKSDYVADFLNHRFF